jgi:peptide deformylase
MLGRTLTEVAPEISLQAYPNPAVTQFAVKVTSPNRQEAITVIVYDQLGKVLHVKRELRSGQVIQVGAGYTQGTYFIEMIQGSNRKRLQVVKTN